MTASELRYHVRYSLRVLRRSPIFSLVAISTLALGIGANTAIFSVVNGVLLRSMPYSDPDRLAILRVDSHRLKGLSLLSTPEVHDLKDQARLLEGVSAFFAWAGMTFSDGENSDGVTTGFILSDLLPLLGTKPFLGRNFTTDENHWPPGSITPVVIVSYEFWQSHLGGDPRAVGRMVVVGGGPCRIVGVMPPHFQFPQVRNFQAGAGSAQQVDLWMPMNTDFKARGIRWAYAIARIKKGVTREQAQSELDGITSRLSKQYTDYNDGDFRIHVEPLQADVVKSARPAIVSLAAAVGFVLLIACANVASLLVARSKMREREIAVRSAIGASSGAIIRQTLTESFVLAMIACAAGLGLAFLGVGLLKRMKPANLPRLDEIQVDGQVIGFTLAVALLTALLFGLMPALKASRLNITETLRSGNRSSGGIPRSRFMRSMVIAEVGLSLVLLICAGLMIRTFSGLAHLNPGFDASQTLAFHAGYDVSELTAAQKISLLYGLRDRFKSLPGVTAAGATTVLPFGGQTVTRGYAGDPAGLSRLGETAADYRIVTPGYFETMRTRLREGRFLEDNDGASNPIAVVVDETLANSAWPGRPALGQRIWIQGDSGSANAPPPLAAQVAGVVEHLHSDRLDRAGRPQIYVPARAANVSIGDFVVRAAGDPRLLVASIRRQIKMLNARGAAFNFRLLEEDLARATADVRFELALMSGFSALALILALIGLYGVISYTVTDRWRELGIRVALGARPADVRSLVLGHGMRLTGTGIALGLLAALAVTPLLRSLLYGITPTDPLTFGVVSVLLLAVSGLACYLPARRATKVDPIETMRAE